jgi:hypothetical protein
MGKGCMTDAQFPARQGFSPAFFELWGFSPEIK